MRSSLTAGALFAVAAAVAMWSCGSGGAGYNAPMPTPTVNPPTPTGNSVTVSILGSTGNKAFAPNPVMVNAGDTLVFKNADAVMHHIVMNDGSADLGHIVPGGRKSTMDQAAA